METLIQGTSYLKMVYLAGTGLGPALSLSKNGAAFAAPAGGAGMIEVGSGWYSFALQAADTDTLGPLAYSLSNGTENATFVDRVIPAPVSDPWAVPVPGAYPPGQAGFVLGHLVNTPDPWLVSLPGAYIAGEAGYIVGHSSSGSDPWATVLPGAYPPGQAGNIVGKNLDTSIRALLYYLVSGGKSPR